ncbi:biotin/lipoyl-binding protein, partial [candidate division KSB1 bacterium]|nr:biotin/lipoyl-binding protein [candidate division KSB1 bacterium]
MKKIILFILIFLLLAILAYILFHQDGPGGQEAASEPTVKTAGGIVFPVQTCIAQRQDLILWVSCSGLARPVREAEITAQSGGRLDSLNASNGKFVRKGELLALIEDATYRLALREAENNLLSSRIEYNIIKAAPTTILNNRPERLQKQIDSLKAAYQQSEQSYKKGQLSEEQFRRVRRNYESLLTYRDFDRDDVVANKCGLNRALV